MIVIIPSAAPAVEEAASLPLPLDAATRYVTNLKVISSLIHYGPPVPKLYEYIVGVNRLEKSMNRQFSTWVSAQDSPILLGASQVSTAFMVLHYFSEGKSL